MNMFLKVYLYLSLLIRTLGSRILRFNELVCLKVDWAIKNSNNKTYPVSYFPISLVEIGDYSYGPIDIYTYGAEGEGLKIGAYCSIARDVKFVLGGNHKTDCFMTFPVKNKFGDTNENQSLTKGKIILEDDVWVGVGSVILSGVVLGQGCVVAAGAVVTKSFLPYSIIGGNPARIIKMRFSADVIDMLEKSTVCIGSLTPKIIGKNIKGFSQTLDEKTIEDLLFYLKN